MCSRRSFRFKGMKPRREVLMLRDPFVAVLNCTYALCTCLAQPSLLGICLAAALQAKPLVTSTTRRGLRILVKSGFAGIHFHVSASKSTGHRMPCQL
jgi:hypothetical protein